MNQIELQDERVREERRKIQSRGYSLVVLALLAVILVQQLVLDAPVKQYAGELLVLIGCGGYQVLANIRHGFDVWHDNSQPKRKLAGSAVISAFLAMLVLSLVTGEKDLGNLVLFLVVYGVCFFGLRLLLAWGARQRQRQLDRQLDEDEEDEER